MPTVTTASLQVQRVISTQTVGVAPLGVTSTTAVANLNADLLDGQHAAAFAAASHPHAAADVTSGTFASARVSEASVTQHQAALAIAWSQVTGEPTTLAGYGITDAAAVGHTHNIEALTTALGTDGQVWTKGAGGAMAWEDATGGGGGLADAFASIENSAGVEQFAASGATPLRFTAGADIGITFDAGDNEIIIAFTGSVSGITRGYADITGDSGASAAVGADTLIVAGAGGISTTASSAPDTLTITLGNHSAALLTSGTLPDARIQASGVTQHQASITGLGTIATGVWNGTVIGSGYGGTGFSTYAAGDLIYASATNVLSKRAAGTDGYVLTMVSGMPAWAAGGGGSVDLAADYPWTGGHSFTDSIAIGQALGDMEAWYTTARVIEGPQSAISFWSGFGQLVLHSNAYVATDGLSKYKVSSLAAARLDINQGTFNFEVATSGTADATITFANKLQITTTGLGFFGAGAVARPTGVAVTAGGIHAALVTLGLISA